jgi:hypothetical protein
MANHKTAHQSMTTLVFAILAMTLLPGAKNGCGSKEANQTLSSPVQAVTTLLERADGRVEADLVLISTATNPHQFVDTAKNVTLRVPGGDSVALTMEAPGRYTASSQTNMALKYVANQTYQFKFELDDASAAKQVNNGNFVAVVDAPDDMVTFSLSEPPAFSGDKSVVTWTPTSRYGLIRIVQNATSKVTYSSFDFDSAQFDGSKWAKLAKGGSKELGVDAFPDAGDYRLSFCAVSKVSDFDTSLSAELGALSGFLIGRCVADQIITVK